MIYKYEGWSSKSDAFTSLYVTLAKLRGWHLRIGSNCFDQLLPSALRRQRW